MSQTNPQHYDLIVIGSGSAGFSAATTAKENGLEKILLIEKRRVGYSLCTNEGCMPSKTLLASAEVKRIIEESTEFGVGSAKPDVDWDTVQDRVRTLVEEDFFAARRDAIHNAPVDLVVGNARFTSAKSIQVGDCSYTADRIVIATGSVVSVPPFSGLKETGYLDSDGALYLKKLPSSLIVLGGGYIAIELGYLFHKMGVDVTIVQRSNRILSSLDADISLELQGILRRDGMNVVTGVDVESVSRSAGNKRVHAAIREGGDTKLEAEEIMIATGRTPAIDGLNLEELGVELDEHGAIQVNDYLQTSVPHIYAVGDVNGKMPLVYVASMEGKIAGLHAAGKTDEKVDYSLVSNIIFSHPEIGTVGLTA